MSASTQLLSALEALLREHGCITAREAHQLLGYGSRVYTGRALKELVRLGRARTSSVDLHGNVAVNLFWLAAEQLTLPIAEAA